MNSRFLVSALVTTAIVFSAGTVMAEKNKEIVLHKPGDAVMSCGKLLEEINYLDQESKIAHAKIEQAGINVSDAEDVKKGGNKFGLDKIVGFFNAKKEARTKEAMVKAASDRANIAQARHSKLKGFYDTKDCAKPAKPIKQDVSLSISPETYADDVPEKRRAIDANFND